MMASLAEKADAWRDHGVPTGRNSDSVVDLSDGDSSADVKLREVMRAQKKMAVQEAKAKGALKAVQRQLSRQSKQRKKRRLGEVAVSLYFVVPFAEIGVRLAG